MRRGPEHEREFFTAYWSTGSVGSAHAGISALTCGGAARCFPNIDLDRVNRLRDRLFNRRELTRWVAHLFDAPTRDRILAPACGDPPETPHSSARATLIQRLFSSSSDLDRVCREFLADSNQGDL